MITDNRGGSLQELPPGDVRGELQGRDPQHQDPCPGLRRKRDQVSQVRIYGSAYSLLYSEESGVLPTGGTAQSRRVRQGQLFVPRRQCERAGQFSRCTRGRRVRVPRQRDGDLGTAAVAGDAVAGSWGARQRSTRSTRRPSSSRLGPTRRSSPSGRTGISVSADD